MTYFHIRISYIITVCCLSWHMRRRAYTVALIFVNVISYLISFFYLISLYIYNNCSIFKFLFARTVCTVRYLKKFKNLKHTPLYWNVPKAIFLSSFFMDHEVQRIPVIPISS